MKPIFAGPIACLLALLCVVTLVAAPGDGLEVDASSGAWAGRAGIRGGGLVVDKPGKIQPLAAPLGKPAGSCTMVIKTSTPITRVPGGVIFAAGDIELVKTDDPTWLELRRGDRAVRKMIYDLKPGRWTHVAITWSEKDLSLYVNGKPASHSVDVKPGKRHDGVFVGSGLGKTVFDEIRTFDRTLPADEIAEQSRISLGGKIALRTPTLTVPKTRKAPTVDGTLAEGEWDRAAGYSNFSKHFSSRFPTANRATKAWMTWDDEHLYMAFKIPVTQPHAKDKRPKDNIRFGDKTVEIFFQPNPSGELEYFQLAFDSVGTQYDARMMDRDYDAPWTVHSTIDEQWWTAEIAVPYKTINALPPEPGHRWKMNLVCTSGQWSPSGTFHEASKYGLVKFVDENNPGLRTGTIEMTDGKLNVPWHLAGSGGMTVRATAYPNKGIVPMAASRDETSRQNTSGTLQLDLGGKSAGMLEIAAFEKPGEIVYQRFIKFDADYMGAVPFLADQPEEVRKPKKPVVKKDATPEQKKKAKAADWRPTVDEIEKLIVEQQTWLGNDIGKTPELPDPWTPMERKGGVGGGGAKDCDLRNSGGLPATVEGLGRRMFAAGRARLVEGKPLGGGEPMMLVKRQRPDCVETVGGTRLENLGITIETRYEFDGFTRYDVTLTPLEGAATVDGLRLSLPFAAERALYYHVWGGNAYGRPTNETANFIGDKPVVTGFEANVWIGDNERGFCWFAEAPRGWSHPDDKDLVKITPRRGTVEVTIDMLRKGTRLSEPVTLTFGTMATPAKPRPRGWRAWEGELSQDWWWYTVFSFPYPARKDKEKFRKENADPFRMPMLSNYFAGMVYMQDGHPVPEQWLFGHLWNARWSQPREPYGKRAGTPGKIVSYSSQAMASSWPDFYMDRLKWMREEYNLRSVYLDTCIRMVNNPFAGYTWTAPDGTTRGSIDIFAFREFQKRIYNFIYQDPQGKVMVHHSNQVAIPILSFADMHMNGEHFNTGPHQVKGRHYSDDAVMPPGSARACYTLKQWGVVPTFLPEHPVSTRAAMGYLWAHDMLLYNAWVNHKVLREGQKVKKSFGMADVAFLGYWEDTPPAKPTPRDIYVSGWRKEDNSSVMLLVANMTDHDRVIDLELIEEHLGIPARFTRLAGDDMEYGQGFTIADGKVGVPVKEHDYRLIRIDNPWSEKPTE